MVWSGLEWNWLGHGIVEWIIFSKPGSYLCSGCTFRWTSLEMPFLAIHDVYLILLVELAEVAVWVGAKGVATDCVGFGVVEWTVDLWDAFGFVVRKGLEVRIFR